MQPRPMTVNNDVVQTVTVHITDDFQAMVSSAGLCMFDFKLIGSGQTSVP